MGEVARLDFFGELVVVRRFEDLIHVGQQGSQCESHIFLAASYEVAPQEE